MIKHHYFPTHIFFATLIRKPSAIGLSHKTLKHAQQICEKSTITSPEGGGLLWRLTVISTKIHCAYQCFLKFKKDSQHWEIKFSSINCIVWRKCQCCNKIHTFCTVDSFLWTKKWCAIVRLYLSNKCWNIDFGSRLLFCNFLSFTPISPVGGWDYCVPRPLRRV
jgi:hypothetical protein